MDRQDFIRELRGHKDRVPQHVVDLMREFMVTLVDDKSQSLWVFKQDVALILELFESADMFMVASQSTRKCCSHVCDEDSECEGDEKNCYHFCDAKCIEVLLH